MMKTNYHTHHYLCGHAKGNVEDYVLEAIKHGFTEIGISDHGPINAIAFPRMSIDEYNNVYLKELEEAGLGCKYATHGNGIFPSDCNGVPFSVDGIGVTGDFIADLSEDMAAEEKARAVYESLIDLTDDPDIIGILLWLRQREIVHFQRFKELYNDYKRILNKKTI